jgi:hypothetical protein
MLLAMIVGGEVALWVLPLAGLTARHLLRRRRQRPRGHGRARARHEWREFRGALLAWAIGCALLLGGVVLVGDATRAGELLGWIGRLTLVVLVWLIWPVIYTL